MQTQVQDPILSARDGSVLHVTLNRPHRGNSLTEPLLTSLLATLCPDRLADVDTVILSGAGGAFSTGGDVSEFHARSSDTDTLGEYAATLVGLLNENLLRLHDLRCAVIADINGLVTGGSLGFVLIADHVVMSETAFIQPYYARMGFAPDGGWTALLPTRIGAGQARNWLVRDRRVAAGEARELGLANQLYTPDQRTRTLRHAVADLAGLDREVIRTSRRLITPAKTLETALEAEREAFLRHITRPETRERMTAFLQPAKRAGDR